MPPSENTDKWGEERCYCEDQQGVVDNVSFFLLNPEAIKEQLVFKGLVGNLH